MMLTAYHFTIS